MVDKQVRGLRSRLNSAQRYLTGQKCKCEELETTSAEHESKSLQRRATIGNLENEGKAHEERLEKLREELNSAETNKQYTAILNEVNTVKQLHSELDERILEHLSAVEEIQKQIEETAEQLQERKKLRKRADTELKACTKEIGDRLSELESQRETAASAVAPTSLAVFDQVAEDFEGDAMVSIMEINKRRREYACSCCNMHLPFDRVSQLMSSDETLVQCPACDRILYLETETRESLAAKK
jgi:predicted  nucleic acid-binding Zn-ribbon protein